MRKALLRMLSGQSHHEATALEGISPTELRKNARSLGLVEHAVALHFMHDHFARIHQTNRVTPAMEADVSDHVWSLEEIVRLLDSR
jgi:hypothetical protein